MTYDDLKKLRVFFSALKDVGFRSNLTPEQIPPFTILDGKRTPVDKTHCLKLLYPMLGLKGEDEKADNQAIIKYLSNPKNRELLLGQFTIVQQAGLKDLLVEKPTTTAEISDQLPQTTIAQQTQPAPVPPPIASGLPPIRPTTAAPKPPLIIIQQATETQDKKTQPTEEKRTDVQSTPETPAIESQPLTHITSTGQPTYTEKVIIPEASALSQETPTVTQLPSENLTSRTTVSPPPFEETQTESPSDTANGLGSTGFDNTLKNLGSGAGTSLKTNLGSIGQGLGKGLTGAARSGLQAAAPSLKNMFNKGLDLTRGMAKPGGIGGIRGPKTPGISTGKGKKVAMILVGVFFIFLIMGLLGDVNGTTPSGQAAPLPPASGQPVQSNLNNCKFTRDGVATPIASSRLSSLFTEVAAKTGVPAAALASLAMHESAVFTSKAENNHDAFGSNITMTTGCAHFATSPTGALGLMQVQPPKAIHNILAAAGKAPPFESVGAYSADGVAKGAQFIGKSADSLTLQDFCDVRTSIYLGAGVLISKNGGKPPTTADEINKSVCGYYGSCVYDKEGVVYNYGNEAQKDFENCKPTAGTAPAPPGPIGVSLTCPIENFSVSCGTATNPVAGCGHGIKPKYATRCNPYYYACDTSSPRGTDGWYEKYSTPLYHAIDVAGTNEVKMPYINGNESVTWAREQPNPIPIGGNGEWGYRINFTATSAQGKKLYLDLTHLSNAGLSDKASLVSGETLGKYIGGEINHLHIGLSVDGNWVEPVQQANMCVK